MGLGNHLIYWFPNTCSCGPPCLNVGFSRNIHIFFMWVDFPFSRGSSQTRDQTKPGLLRCRQILYQLSHQESLRILEWVAYPFPGNLPDPGIKPGSPALLVDSLPAVLPGRPSWYTTEPHGIHTHLNTH